LPTKIIAKVGDFEIIVDEPSELGGTNEGPNPGEYLLIALAGCLSITGHPPLVRIVLYAGFEFSPAFWALHSIT